MQEMPVVEAWRGDKAKDDLEIRGGDVPVKSYIIFKERFVL